MANPVTNATPAATGPWYSNMTGYHWWVLTVASLGWLFDTMDQRIFILVRQPALEALLPQGVDVKTYGAYATSVFMLGWATGGLYFGMLSDRWGRARAMMLAILVYAGFTGLSAASQNQWDFMFYRFLTGIGVGGEFAAGVTLVAESMPVRARSHALGILQALSAVGNITGSGLAYFVLPAYGWRWMFLVGLLPALLVAAIFNRMKEPEAWLQAREAVKRGEHTEMGSIGDLFADQRWRRHSFIGLALAVSGVIGLWGIGFWSPELIREALGESTKQVQNEYVAIGTLLQDVGAFFGIAAFTLVTARIGRRPSFLIFYLLAMGATVMTFASLHTKSDIFWMIPILGFCNLSIFGGYSIYLPELYPTRLRSTGVGFCYNVGRILAALGPFTFVYLIAAYKDVGAASPFRYAAMTLASIYMVGMFTLLFAPETKDKPLPE